MTAKQSKQMAREKREERERLTLNEIKEAVGLLHMDILHKMSPKLIKAEAAKADDDQTRLTARINALRSEVTG